MDYVQAYKTIVEASKEKNTKEIPLLLSLYDFENKNCLEIGPGILARIAIKLSGFAKSITLVEKDAKVCKHLKQLLKKQKLAHKIKVINANFSKDKLMLKQKFDVVYAAWLPFSVLTQQAFIDQACKLAKDAVIFIVSSPRSDTTKMIEATIDRFEGLKRRKAIRQITRMLKKHGFEVKIKHTTLLLDFKNFNSIYGVFKCFDYGNKKLPAKIEEKLRKFLKARVHCFKDGACYIAAYRKNKKKK